MHVATQNSIHTPALNHPQLDLGLIERVQKDWLEGALAAARDERRKYDRRAYEYDSAR